MILLILYYKNSVCERKLLVLHRHRMNTLQLLESLHKIPAHTGVFPSDRIPKIWTKPSAYIFNTRPHSHPGEHWTAMFVNRDGRGIFFDSFGEPPSIPEYLQRIRKNTTLYVYNKKQLQSLDSTVCGEFCVFFLHCMCIGLNLDQFIDLFTDDTAKNDKLVHEYVEKFNNRKLVKSDGFIGFGRNSSSSKHVQTCRCYFHCI